MNADRKVAGAKERVFVALWPRENVRTRLEKVAEQAALEAPGARCIPSSNYHLTLAFIGTLSHALARTLAALLEDRPVTEFDWEIDRIGRFRAADVVWAGGRHNPALTWLAQGVREFLDSRSIDYDRKAFAPHVTLLRHVVQWHATERAIAPPILWPCGRPVLLRSVTAADGVAYVPVKTPKAGSATH
jgi:RNA 2',3'-cyclic 3'-phosphodiesterase